MTRGVKNELISDVPFSPKRLAAFPCLGSDLWKKVLSRPVQISFFDAERKLLDTVLAAHLLEEFFAPGWVISLIYYLNDI